MEKTISKLEQTLLLNKFKARDFQRPLMDALLKHGYKRLLALWPRRAGKDLCAFNAMIFAALEKVGLYVYCLPTASQAKKVIWDGITISGMKILDYIPPELIKSKHQQEMKIRLINDSIILLAGSDNYDRLMGINAQGIVFSEYALQDPDAYRYLRPVLSASGGWALFISCVSPNTLVLSKNGLQRIKNVSSSREEYTDLNKPIYGLGGFHNAEQFYYGGNNKTLKISLRSGYSLECTPIHPVWNGSEWIKSADLKVGDLIPIQYGQNVWGDGLDISEFRYKRHGHSKDIKFNYCDKEFFYFLGLMHADGNYTNNALCITNKKDPEIQSFLNQYGFKTRKDGIHHELCSKELSALLKFLGFKHGARNKVFPDKILECSREQMIPFLQGLFDGDGTSNSNPSKRGALKITSTCLEFIQDLQIVLLNFGIVSGIIKEIKLPTKKVDYTSTIYNLEIGGYFAHVFYRDIGFRLNRKQKNKMYISPRLLNESGNIYPINVALLDGYSLSKSRIKNPKRISRRMISFLNKRVTHPYLEELLKEKLYYSPIKEIIQSESEVFDFVIPETHSFFSNGFISHNTPRGKNHLYSLYNVAKNSPEWFCSKLTVDDTHHISIHDIKKEISLGEISEDLAKQEYWTSFEQGIEGSYYSRYIDNLRLKSQIGDVPWEPSHLVYTAWDIGVRDSTTIIWFQVIGQTIRIIDSYEKNREGLEHYINLVLNKPYTYATHFAPHDMKQMEFGSGITRYAKAKDLGITFKVVDNIPIVDGIELVRSTLPRCWFNEDTTKPLVKALENYRQEWDSKRNVYRGKPIHDMFSHFCDGFRYLCVGLRYAKKGTTPEELERRYREARYGTDHPDIFNDQNNNRY